MSTKILRKRFLMTVPQPLHNWLSKEAEKFGVSIQDRVRVMLEEQKRIINIAKKEKIKHKKHDEVEEKCYLIGKQIYDEFATERQRLQINTISKNGGTLYFEDEDTNESIVIPVISKSFYPFDYESKISLYDEVIPEERISEYRVSEAAKKVADLENKLLSVCKDGDLVYEATPFKCQVWFKDGIWKGIFIVCINSVRTPTLADVMRVTS